MKRVEKIKNISPQDFLLALRDLERHFREDYTSVTKYIQF